MNRTLATLSCFFAAALSAPATAQSPDPSAPTPAPATFSSFDYRLQEAEKAPALQVLIPNPESKQASPASSPTTPTEAAVTVLDKQLHDTPPKAETTPAPVQAVAPVTVAPVIKVAKPSTIIISPKGVVQTAEPFPPAPKVEPPMAPAPKVVEKAPEPTPPTIINAPAPVTAVVETPQQEAVGTAGASADISAPASEGRTLFSRVFEPVTGAFASLFEALTPDLPPIGSAAVQTTPPVEKPVVKVADAPAQAPPPVVLEKVMLARTPDPMITVRRESLHLAKAPDPIPSPEELGLLEPAAGEAAAANISVTTEPASEPKPSLSAETRKALKAIPSGIDSTPPAKKEHLSIARKGGSEKPEPAADAAGPYDMAVSGSKKVPLDAGLELSAAYNSLVAGDFESALRNYKNILESEPKNKQALFGAAATYHRLGQAEKARPYYLQLLKLDPTHREGLNNFLALAAQEAPGEALESLRQLKEQSPEFSPIPAQIAYIYQKIGQPERALDYMMQAYTLAPENLTYKYNLAILFDQLGKKQEAMTLYKQLIEASFLGAALPGSVESIQRRLTFLGSN